MKKEKKPSTNREIISITYIFVGIFVLLLTNFAYFIFIQSRSVINNPYNGRQDLLAERVVRGKILGNNGEVLAETVTDANGNETRNYPYGAEFSHIVGRFSKGKTGIELSENFNLLTANVNVFEKVSNEMAGNKNDGDNVVTTLDVALQKVAYDALGNKKGAIVVLEPSTGKVLAMVSKPDYNPNTVSKEWDNLVDDEEKESALINRATQGLYPPGSTFKILTTLEYLRENGENHNYKYNCKGKETIGDVVINCYGNKAHGKEDLKQSFAKSCNAAFANIGVSLKKDKFRELCDNFLFNTDLPTELASKQSSFVLEQSSKQEELLQTVIGQGKTQMTPLHNALIVSTIANGGTLMKPYVVDHIENVDGRIIEKNMPSTYKNLLSNQEVKILTEYMEAVVEEGTASKLKGLSYRVAGKTGSAEFDSTKASHSWFVGFAPVDNPQIAVSIIVEGAGTGSEYAVPIAKKIFDAALK